MNLEILKPWNSETSLSLFLHPDFVTLQMSRNVFDGFDIGNADRSRDGLDDLFQLPANVAIRGGIHRRGLDLIDKLALGAGHHHHAGKMRDALNRFFLVVDEVRRNKDKEQNQRDHDVVVQAAPLIRPKNVSTNCPPDRTHGRDSALSRRRVCFGSLPVYLGIHGMANRLSYSGSASYQGMALAMPKILRNQLPLLRTGQRDSTSS